METRSHTLLPLLLLLLSLLAASLPNAAASSIHRIHRRPSTAFVHISCNATLYPRLCEQQLSPYAPVVRRSPRRIAFAALQVTHRHAQSTTAYLSALAARHGSGRSRRSRGSMALQDCADTMRDGLGIVRQCISQMLHMGRRTNPAFLFRLGNVQTWASAALTDETTCLDGLDEDMGVDGAVKAEVRRRVGFLSQVTSNALALVNRIDMPLN